MYYHEGVTATLTLEAATAVSHFMAHTFQRPHAHTSPHGMEIQWPHVHMEPDLQRHWEDLRGSRDDDDFAQL